MLILYGSDHRSGQPKVYPPMMKTLRKKKKNVTKVLYKGRNAGIYRLPNFAGVTLNLIRMEETKEEKKTECQEKAYANLLCDFMFKRMFCSEANKDVLIWFLNMVLEDVEIKRVDL